MKKDGWPQLLDDYVTAAMSREFAYGTHDCALFCADWKLLATGVDPAKDFRGYGSMLQAYRIVNQFGSLKAMATHLLRTEPTHPAWAQRGDIVLMSNAQLLTDVGGDVPEVLGICLGRSSAFPNKKGLWMLPTLEATAAWKIR